VIKDFLNMLNETERNHCEKNTLLFASRQTMESLRVTLLSVLDIIEDLFAAEGTQYVLTAKLNQDPLERFFGIVRCFKGDEDHPSITQFSQIYRLLSLYTPLKTAIKGNCTDPCDSVLVSFHDSLGSKAKAAAELKATIESKLHKKLQCIISFPDENDTQSSSNCGATQVREPALEEFCRSEWGSQAGSRRNSGPDRRKRSTSRGSHEESSTALHFTTEDDIGIPSLQLRSITFNHISPQR
ncbi:hypothetical protein MTO96_035607, partial [Rhipicephalus appendiculatus]